MLKKGKLWGEEDEEEATVDAADGRLSCRVRYVSHTLFCDCSTILYLLRASSCGAVGLRYVGLWAEVKKKFGDDRRRRVAAYIFIRQHADRTYAR
jgi:hypothetical protein